MLTVNSECGGVRGKANMWYYVITCSSQIARLLEMFDNATTSFAYSPIIIPPSVADITNDTAGGVGYRISGKIVVPDDTVLS
jgi:hypothetical protein